MAYVGWAKRKAPQIAAPRNIRIILFRRNIVSGPCLYSKYPPSTQRRMPGHRATSSHVVKSLRSRQATGSHCSHPHKTDKPSDAEKRSEDNKVIVNIVLVRLETQRRIQIVRHAFSPYPEDLPAYTKHTAGPGSARGAPS